jgi:predicted neutral ceramidase superfamily lipid hydrolase
MNTITKENHKVARAGFIAAQAAILGLTALFRLSHHTSYTPPFIFLALLDSLLLVVLVSAVVGFFVQGFRSLAISGFIVLAICFGFIGPVNHLNTWF